MTDPTTVQTTDAQVAAPEVIAAADATPAVVQQAPAFGDAEVESYLAQKIGRPVTINSLLEPQPTFANQLSAKVNELIAAGKPMADVVSFIQLQNIEPSSLDDIGAIRTEYSLKYPSLPPDQIDALISRQVADPSSEDKGDIAFISVRAKEARAFIESQKVSTDIKIEDPSAKAVRLADESARAAVLQQNWPKVLTSDASVGKQGMTMDLEGGKYSFDFEIPKDTLETAIAEVTKMAVAQKMDFTPENQKYLAETARKLAVMQNIDTLMAAVAKDAFDSGRSAALSQISGPKAPQVNINTTGQPVQEKPAPKFLN